MCRSEKIDYSNINEFVGSLEELFADFKWPYQNIKLYSDNGLSENIGKTGGSVPLDDVEATVSQMFDTYIAQCLQDYFSETAVEVERGHIRQYPDIELRGEPLPETPLALDIKSAMRNPDNEDVLNSAVAVGTHGTYFNNPRKDCTGIKRPYGTYNSHIVLVFVYSIFDNYSQLSERRYVDDIEITAAQKWEMATTQSASGRRNYIAAPRRVKELLHCSGDFDCREDFEQYWQDPVGEAYVSKNQLSFDEFED